ncbi:cytochrome P450 2G1-like [Passerculus sandwichensis]
MGFFCFPPSQLSERYGPVFTLSDHYGPVFTVWLGSRPVLVLRGTEAVREALVGSPEVFAGRGRLPTIESTFRGYGVVFADGERWRALRRFSLTVLRDLGMGRGSIESRIQEEAQELLGAFQDTKGEPFDPTFLLSCAVSNVICSIVFGRRFRYDDAEFLQLLRMMNDVFREMSTPWAQVGIGEIWGNLGKFGEIWGKFGILGIFW